jgi:hypothetical protein
MSEFLSKLIARSLSDAPVIQPRVPSLFEPVAVEFLEELQSSTPAIGVRQTIAPTNMSAPLREVSPVEKTAPAAPNANASDPLVEEHRSKPDVPCRQASRAIDSSETKSLIVPLVSSRGEEDRPGNTSEVPEAFSKTRPIQPRHRKDLSPVEQRSSTSAPVIRVTIGRVEVRAIHPPAPAPKPAKPAPPKLSLEDYLGKRERGSR